MGSVLTDLAVRLVKLKENVCLYLKTINIE